MTYLTEGKADYIAANQGAKILAAYTTDTEKKSKSALIIINKLIKADPTPNQQYLQWIVNLYIRGQFKLEDISRIRSELLEFIRVKSKLAKKDINQYYSLPELYDALAPFQKQEVISNKEADRQEKQRYFDKKKAVLFYKGKDITVIIPKTQDASCYFGKGTKWCTAADKANKFAMYNKKGPLYIILTPSGKYQFHLQDRQFMDERDQRVNVQDLVKRYPELLDVFDAEARKVHYLPLYKNISENDVLAAVTQNGYALQYVPEPMRTEKVCLAAVTQDGFALQFVPESMKTEQVCLAAVTENGYALDYVPKHMQEIS